MFAGWAADKWGRKRTILFAAVWALIAGGIQAGAVHIGMLIAGRILGGFAVGIMSELVVDYILIMSNDAFRHDHSYL